MTDEKLSLAEDNCRDDNVRKNLSPKVPLDSNIDEKDGNITTNVESNAQQVPPISFMQLFRSVKSLSAFWVQCLLFIRYSTTFELCLDSIGLIAAAAAGAAAVCTYFFFALEEVLMFFLQPLMSLLFSDLTQQFVDFTAILSAVKAGKSGFSEQLPAAAAGFRHSAGKSAAGLVYLGELHVILECFLILILL